VRFVEKEHLLFRRKSLPFHPNGLRFAALDAQGQELLGAEYFSVGGGFVVDARGERVFSRPRAAGRRPGALPLRERHRAAGAVPHPRPERGPVAARQ
jgi:hypothetical protein